MEISKRESANHRVEDDFDFVLAHEGHDFEINIARECRGGTSDPAADPTQAETTGQRSTRFSDDIIR
jgi:hypothetical protein